MDDQFACAALFKGFLGTWPQLTDDMDGLSVLGEQARKVVHICAYTPWRGRRIFTADDSDVSFRLHLAVPDS